MPAVVCILMALISAKAHKAAPRRPLPPPPAVVVQARDTDPPKIKHDVVSQATIGQNIDIIAHITDRSKIYQPKLYFRQIGDLEFIAIDLVNEGKPDIWVGTVPATFAIRDIEYFIEAFDEHGNGPGREGSPEAPFLVKVAMHIASTRPAGEAPGTRAPSEPPVGEVHSSVAKRGWFWAVLVSSVLVVGAGGTVGYLYLAKKGPFAPVTKHYSSVILQVTAPDPRGGL